MAIETFGGKWRTKGYKTTKEKDGPWEYRGAEIELHFAPNELVDSPKIGLVQTVNSLRGGTPEYLRPEVKDRSNTSDQGDEGRHIDRAGKKTNPVYGKNNPGGADKSLASGASASNSHWGKRTVDAKGKVTAKDDAWLWDGPTLDWNEGETLSQTFEATALSVAGTQEGTYYGSVEWGVVTDAKGKVSLKNLKVISMGAPTATWMKSAKNWNEATVDVDGTETDTQDLPTTDHGSLSSKEFKKLSDDDLKARVEKLTGEIEGMDAASADFMNRQFELRALQREAMKRKTVWGAIKHFFTGSASLALI